MVAKKWPSDARILYFDYQARPWQAEVLKALEERRLAIVVAHRRAGKTELMILRLLLAAMTLEREHPAPTFAYVAPFLKQAKAVAWERLKYYCRPLPDLQISESELTVTLWNGATISLFGADHPDRLRGLGFDGTVLDEVAQMRPETWPAVIRPALADRSGWAAFIGTPKGLNIFYDLYRTALETPHLWYAGHFPADQTGVIPPAELAQLQIEMGEAHYRREFLGDFTADQSNNFIDYQAWAEASCRQKPPVNQAPLVFGVDVARFGADRTVLVERRGLVLEKIATWQGRDLMSTAAEVATAINSRRPTSTFVDAVGLGAGVVDRLRQLGHKVLAVNSGAKAARPNQFANLKAEMWSKMRDWLLEGAVIPNNGELRTDLLAPNYEFDAQGRLKIESKDELRARGQNSTDCADALALTFAFPVASSSLRQGRKHFAEMD